MNYRHRKALRHQRFCSTILSYADCRMFDENFTAKFVFKKGACMNKLEKIEHEVQKAREKITAAQSLLKQIENQRTEQENLQIVQQIRALKLSRDELYFRL